MKKTIIIILILNIINTLIVSTILLTKSPPIGTFVEEKSNNIKAKNVVDRGGNLLLDLDERKIESIKINNQVWERKK